MISLRNVEKRFDDLLVFKNVNVDINDGDSVVIIGGSGCGKSTLLRCINRLTEPTEGQIIYNGKDIMSPENDINEMRRSMGMVYQSFNLFSHLNVLENVILAPMKVLGMSEEDAIKEAEEYLTMVGMIDRKYFMPHELSGGQKQRVAIARTLAMHPDVILFDEPTSALDPTMVGEVENVIKKLIASGITSVMVTHDMRFARSVANKVIFLAEQTVYETGSAVEVFDNPQKKLTREFFFKNRMYQAEIDKDVTDIPSIITQLFQFISKYDFDNSQKYLINSVIDELIVPVFENSKGEISHASLKLVCSESSKNHMIFVSFPGLDSDPLESGLLDELNVKILEGRSQDVSAMKTKSGEWEVSIQM